MADADGEGLLSTAEAARLAGVTVSGFRTLAWRAMRAGTDLRAPAAQWLDRRTPTYSAAELRDYLAGRPGRGRARGE